MALIWPDGFTASGNPLSIHDASGKQIGIVGRQIALGGGLAPDGTTTMGCTGVRESWLVGTVIDQGR